MKSINQIVIGILIFSIGIFNPLNLQSQEEVYCNNRFNFCMRYSSEMFGQKVLSENGDGLELHSVDGNVILKVSGIYNVLSSTIDEEFELFKEYLKRQEKEFKIFSSVIDSDQFVVYASSGDAIYYQKTTIFGTHLVSISILSKMPTLEQSKRAIEVISSDLVFFVYP